MNKSTPAALNPVLIIVNFERPEDTIECLDSVVLSDYKPADILLVDNGSKDDSINKISLAHPGITLLALPENSGFVGGYNAGIKQALKTNATHLFLLNNDTVIDRSAIQFLLTTDWDVSVPKILYHDNPEIIWAAGSQWRSFPPSVIMQGYNRKDGPEFDIPMSLNYATGCAFMAKRAVFERVGDFDDQFTNYMEDYDFFYRVNAAGFSIGYVPEARIYHKVSKTLGGSSPEFRYYLGRNTVWFYRKADRYPSWKLWIYIVWVLIRETMKGNINHIPDYWRGYMEGFNLLKERT